jgi:hypothetical protein
MWNLKHNTYLQNCTPKIDGNHGVESRRMCAGMVKNTETVRDSQLQAVIEELFQSSYLKTAKENILPY